MTLPRKGQGKRREYPFNRQLKRKARRIVYALVIAALAGVVGFFQKQQPADQNAKTDTTSQLTQEQGGTVSSVNPGLTNPSLSPETGAIQKSNPPELLDKLRKAAQKPGSQFWLSINGEVIKLLKDDLKGSRHQKFLLRPASDITLLISHNIDLAERIPVNRGEWVSIRGRYEWNNRGGVIHWTHHDPRGKKQGGWIRHAGREYR